MRAIKRRMFPIRTCIIQDQTTTKLKIGHINFIKGLSCQANVHYLCLKFRSFLRHPVPRSEHPYPSTNRMVDQITTEIEHTFCPSVGRFLENIVLAHSTFQLGKEIENEVNTVISLHPGRTVQRCWDVHILASPEKKIQDSLF